ncbi:hypothetical protein C8F04DRAFT_1196479 [Mycena alexandri]|uniref:Uncharacterized protein n=1 Tax=Mycena alexandri TaxID=1745969 RepID=A0AAD6S4T5_9AGAR|nr:hypothetical protein C8F04DRAFT_1196479 [Mycena alexandri]
MVQWEVPQHNGRYHGCDYIKGGGRYHGQYQGKHPPHQNRFTGCQCAVRKYQSAHPPTALGQGFLKAQYQQRSGGKGEGGLKGWPAHHGDPPQATYQPIAAPSSSHRRPGPTLAAASSESRDEQDARMEIKSKLSRPIEVRTSQKAQARITEHNGPQTIFNEEHAKALLYLLKTTKDTILSAAMPPRTTTPALPAADASRPRTRAATGSTRNTPTAANARLPSSRPVSAALQADTPQTSPTRAPTTAAPPSIAAPVGVPTASDVFLQPVGTTSGAPARIPGFYDPPPPSATHDTINLVSPTGSAIDLVSPTGPAASLETAASPTPDDRSAVRSPPPQGATSVPIAAMIAAASDALAAGVEVVTATAALTIDTGASPAPTPSTANAGPAAGAEDANFPALPNAGEELMSPDSAAARRAAKGKGKDIAEYRTAADGDQDMEAVHNVLSPIDLEELTIRTLGATSIDLADPNLGNFFDEHVRPDPFVLAQLERVSAAEVNAESDALLVAEVERNAQRAVEAENERNLQRGLDESLGRATTSPHGASTSRRPAGESGSPPKRARVDAGNVRVTRASSAAAQQAAAAAAAAINAPRPATAAPSIPHYPTFAAAAAAHTANNAGAAAPAPAPVAAPAPQHPPQGAPPVAYTTYDGLEMRAFITPCVNLPETTGTDFDTLALNADPAVIQTWRNTPGTIAAYVAGGDRDSTASAHNGAELIANVTNMPAGVVRMGAANAANTSLPAPNLFGITGLTPDLAAELVRLRMLCTQAITLFIITLAPHFSGFLGLVEGLTFLNTPAGAQEAVNAITHTLSTNTNFIQLVMSHRDALPAHWSIQQALTAILGSLTVTPIELLSGVGSTRVVWRVFMMVTTRNMVFYNAIRAAFRQVVFVTAFNNTGRVRDDLSCRICRSIDHPTQLCPFPDVPGYVGPTAATLPPPPPPPGRGRGNGRGRGRGRGGRGRGARGN